MKRKVNNKEERKQELQKLNEPPVLTILEEVGNAITHGVGAVLALVGFILLLLKSDTGMKVMASCFYGISLFILMLMSCLYGKSSMSNTFAFRDSLHSWLNVK